MVSQPGVPLSLSQSLSPLPSVVPSLFPPLSLFPLYLGVLVALSQVPPRVLEATGH